MSPDHCPPTRERDRTEEAVKASMRIVTYVQSIMANEKAAIEGASRQGIRFC
jgi:hypothetical protein